jgi:hypothetical protein
MTRSAASVISEELDAVSNQGAGELVDGILFAVSRAVSCAPPLTATQRARIAAAFGSVAKQAAGDRKAA